MLGQWWTGDAKRAQQLKVKLQRFTPLAAHAVPVTECMVRALTRPLLPAFVILLSRRPTVDDILPPPFAAPSPQLKWCTNVSKPLNPLGPGILRIWQMKAPLPPGAGPMLPGPFTRVVIAPPVSSTNLLTSPPVLPDLPKHMSSGPLPLLTLKCILMWLKVTVFPVNCPICRTPVNLPSPPTLAVKLLPFALTTLRVLLQAKWWLEWAIAWYTLQRPTLVNLLTANIIEQASPLLPG